MSNNNSPSEMSQVREADTAPHAEESKTGKISPTAKEFLTVYASDAPNSTGYNLPLESDGSLQLTTLRGRFPAAVGLEFKSPGSSAYDFLAPKLEPCSLIDKYIVVCPGGGSSTDAEIKQTSGAANEKKGIKRKYGGGESSGTQKCSFPQKFSDDPEPSSPPDNGSLESLKKYLFYFHRPEIVSENIDQLQKIFRKAPKRCVTAISPTHAITFRHGNNVNIGIQRQNEDKQWEAGKILTVYSYETDEDGNPMRTVKAEAVMAEDVLDFILLKAVKGQKFFDSNREDILADPVLGEKSLIIGLSQHQISPAVLHGNVCVHDQNFGSRHGYATSTVWKGESGAGVFDTVGDLIGMEIEYMRNAETPTLSDEERIEAEMEFARK
ncbi:hypothetical protein Ddc_09442 [Ditylenchus destructor]|nr:hypothetical protein Ddc_09442 [Ditylenchus destructor]